MNKWRELCFYFFFRHNSSLREIYSISKNLSLILYILDARCQCQWMNNQYNHYLSLLWWYIHYWVLKYTRQWLIYHRRDYLRSWTHQFSTLWHHARSSSRLWWELVFSRVELEIILLTRWVILFVHIYFSYKVVRIHLFRLSTIAKEMIEFFAIVVVEIVHLIFKWWLSDRTKTRFRFRDFESRTWNRSIRILIRLIRIDDDNDFFTFCIINIIIIIKISDVFEFVVHVS
jgi:hypothetical protein